VDAEGKLAVAHCGLGCARLFSRLGEPLACLRSPRGSSATNFCFEAHLLPATESDSGIILSAEMPTQRPMLYSHG
jgi:gluconolactonase